MLSSKIFSLLFTTYIGILINIKKREKKKNIIVINSGFFYHMGILIKIMVKNLLAAFFQLFLEASGT